MSVPQKFGLLVLIAFYDTISGGLIQGQEHLAPRKNYISWKILCESILQESKQRFDMQDSSWIIIRVQRANS